MTHVKLKEKALVYNLSLSGQPDAWFLGVASSEGVIIIFQYLNWSPEFWPPQQILPSPARVTAVGRAALCHVKPGSRTHIPPFFHLKDVG